MRDHKFKLQPGEQIQREVHFDFMRIIDCDGVLSLEFPTARMEMSDFSKGDFLRFDEVQGEILAANKTDAELTVWIKTSSGATMQSALLTGDVNIAGVNQDANDEPLFVRTGRGLDIDAVGSFVVIGKLLAAPVPGTSGIRYVGTANVPDWGKYAYLHVTNNSMIQQGAGQQIIDRRIAIIPSSASLLPVRWIGEGETVVLPVMNVVTFGAIITNADWTNDALSLIHI